MLKTGLIALAVAASAVAVAPTASAQCLYPDGTLCYDPDVPSPGPVVQRVKDALERLPDPSSLRCWYYPDTGDIRCEWG